MIKEFEFSTVVTDDPESLFKASKDGSAYSDDKGFICIRRGEVIDFEKMNPMLHKASVELHRIITNPLYVEILGPKLIDLLRQMMLMTITSDNEYLHDVAFDSVVKLATIYDNMTAILIIPNKAT